MKIKKDIFQDLHELTILMTKLEESIMVANSSDFETNLDDLSTQIQIIKAKSNDNDI